jgi:hypothetical protein
MKGYFVGFAVAQFLRILRVFPNNDPIMGFVLPASKNEEWWKGPLFAFSAMFLFDLFTGFGIWTFVTAGTYALVAFGARAYMKGKKSSFGLYAKTGFFGILFFDFVTGPLMGTFIFGQNFFAVTLLQIPFTLMHVFSGILLASIIVPFYDPAVNLEIKSFFALAKTGVAQWVPRL